MYSRRYNILCESLVIALFLRVYPVRKARTAAHQCRALRKMTAELKHRVHSGRVISQ